MKNDSKFSTQPVTTKRFGHPALTPPPRQLQKCYLKRAAQPKQVNNETHHVTFAEFVFRM